MTAAVKKSGANGMMLGFIAACLFIYVCYIAADIMIPFVFAVFLWYLINAIARVLGMVKLPGGKRLSEGLRTSLGILALLGMMFLIYELVHQNIDDVVREAPKFQESFEKIVRQAAALAHVEHVPTLRELADELVGKYVDIGATMRAFAALLTGMAGKALVIILFIGFLLYEQRFFARKIRWMFPEKATQERVREILKTIDIKVQRYIGVKSFVSFLDSFLTFMILSAFSVDFAGFWGVMAFFLHFIPYAGSFVAISMPVLIALIQFGDLGTTFMVLAALSVSHAFLGHILDPYMMGNNLNLSPIFIITNLAIWGMIWGVPGMFLAIPILAIVTITLAQFERTRPLAILVSKTGVIDSKPKKH